MSGVGQALVGTSTAKPKQIAYTTSGSYIWTAPEGVTTVCAVCIGGLGASDSYFINSSTVRGGSSNFNLTGGTYTGDGGGNGGNGGSQAFNRFGGGGGGAGGYTSDGGQGKTETYNSFVSSRGGGGGGGVGIFGGSAGGSGGGAGLDSSGGSGGSGGGLGEPGSFAPNARSSGGSYGGGAGGSFSTSGTWSASDGYGGGGLGWKNNIPVTPGAQYDVQVASGGAVRIIWGNNRAFPNTNTQDM